MEENTEGFIQGEKKAFDRVYEKYAPSVFGICMRYSSCRDDAQEILQETFIRVYENRQKADPALPLGPWIKTIAIRTAINYLKKQHKLVLKEDETYFETVEDESGYADDDLQEMRAKLLGLLAEMPAGYRAVFNLYAIDNLTHKEIAAYLQITEGASKSQLSKARNWIKMNLNNMKNNERA